MNRHHLFPAAVALAAHVLVLFGFSSPPPLAVPVGVPPSIEIVVRPAAEPDVLPPPEDPEDAETRTGGPAATGPTPPVGPELPPVETRDGIVVTIPPPTPFRPSGDQTLLPRSTPTWGGGGDGTGEGGWGSVLRLDALDNVPRATFQPPPSYPYEQKRLGIHGTVTVRFWVDETGHVRDPRVVEAEVPALAESALRAVAKWRFEPGRKDGRVVRFQMTVPIVFRVTD